MRLFGMPVPFTGRKQKAVALSSVHEGRGWTRVFESFTGAWQRDVVIDQNAVSTQFAVYACRTLISQDIAKLRIKLVELKDTGVWSEVKNAAYSPVLRKPNPFQTRIQFIESWILSKLSTGNTYVLKQRDGRGVVTALFVLDPRRVTVLVADDGSVFYQLQSDNLPGVSQAVTVPAREIIHDRFNCLFHPLVGTSPIIACGLAAMQGLNIQNYSATFFANQSRPGGILTAPGQISDDIANRLKTSWVQNFSGKNAGQVAVLGDGINYERMGLTAEESQLIDQMRWPAEVVASTHHVPPYKIGVGQMPTANNTQALNIEYYTQCLQSLIEAFELCLDEGLGIGENLGTELEVDNLWRMDSVAQMDMLKKSDGILTPNEQRLVLNRPPVTGGNNVYKQQQDFSLEALAKRDAQADPFASGKTVEPPKVEAVTLLLPAPKKEASESDAVSAGTALLVQKLFSRKEAA